VKVEIDREEKRKRTVVEVRDSVFGAHYRLKSVGFSEGREW